MDANALAEDWESSGAEALYVILDRSAQSCIIIVVYI